MTHKPLRKRDRIVAWLKRLAHAHTRARGAIRRLRQRLPHPVKRALRGTTRFTLHAILGVLISLALIFVAARLWLPTLADKKPEIETYLRSTAGSPVRLGTLTTYWDGLNPGVRVKDFQIDTAAGQPAIRLKEVRLSLAWWPLLTGRIAIGSLTLVEPSLAVERRADGTLRVSGLEAQTVPEQPGEGAAEWLLRQREMVIENGELVWLDRLSPGKGERPDQAERLAIKHVNVTLRNDGNRHHFDFRAAFPIELCADCRLSADITGDPFAGEKWDGEIALKARGLALPALPRVLRARLPAGLEGRVSLRLDTRWRAGRPAAAEGYASVSELRLPLPGEPEPLEVSMAETSLTWKGKVDDWRLDLRQLRLGLTGSSWTAGSLRLDRHGGHSNLRVDHVDVGDIARFVARLRHEGPVFAWLRAAQPAGSLERVRIEVDSGPDAPPEFAVDAGLSDIRFDAYERIPGVQGLSGRLRLTHDSGEFRLASGKSRVLLPRVFREPLDLMRMASRVRWRQGSDDWLVQAEDIALAARDGQVRGNVELRLPKDPAVSPVLKLRMDLSDGDGANAARYYPLILPQGLRTWLQRAVVSGQVTEGSVVFHGALRDFPFRDGQGKFEVRAHVRDGVFEYLPGWEPMRDVEADLNFTGIGMLITADKGRIRTLGVERVAVTIDDYKAPGGTVVRVNGRAVGPLAESLAVLADSKAPRFAPYLPAGLHAEGGGVLSLDLRIPAHAPEKVTIGGHYRFLNGSLTLPFRAIQLDDLRGSIEFSESGLRAGQLRARLLGGDTFFEAVPEANGARVEARGTITQAGLTRLLGAGLSATLNGEVPWKAQAHMRPQGSELLVESDLRGLEIRLPAPLAKARGEPLGLVLRTSGSEPDAQVLDLQAEGRLSGRLAFRRGADGWTLARGRIGVGERVTVLPSEEGLTLGVRLPALSVDPWWKLLRQKVSDTDGLGWLDTISHVRAEVDALEAFGRPFGQLSLDLDNRPDGWQGRLQGEAIAGQVVLIPPCGGRVPCVTPVERPGQPAPSDRLAIQLTLARLVLPPVRPGTPETAVDPRALPLLRIRSESFRTDGRDFGVLEFRAEPVPLGWRIVRLKLTRPEAILAATGLWEADQEGRQSTHFDAVFNSTDFGLTLGQMGYPGEMAGGRLVVDSNWSWPGAPGDFEIARLNGAMQLSLSKGRLPNISPGAGRLLGVLELRSVTRYLALDFSNVFGKGLAFDSIKGKVVVAQGNARMRDFMIRAAGADIELSGRLGLAARDVDLNMGVTPRLMEELAVTGGLIGGPAVGAAVALLHNLIKKPFEKSTRIEYTVKGGWDDPVVTRLGGPVVEPLPPMQ